MSSLRYESQGWRILTTSKLMTYDFTVQGANNIDNSLSLRRPQAAQAAQGAPLANRDGIEEARALLERSVRDRIFPGRRGRGRRQSRQPLARSVRAPRTFDEAAPGSRRRHTVRPGFSHEAPCDRQRCHAARGGQCARPARPRRCVLRGMARQGPRGRDRSGSAGTRGGPFCPPGRPAAAWAAGIRA